MTRRYSIGQAVHYAMVVGAAVVAGHAATASAQNAKTPAHLGKVTVTGTRIKRTNIETAQPITRINRQQIQQSGYTNIGELLGRLSFAGAHSNNAGLYTGGEHTVSLRNLGASRNLVLV